MNELTNRLRPWFWLLILVLTFGVYWFVKPHPAAVARMEINTQEAAEIAQRIPQLENAWVRVCKCALDKAQPLDFQNNGGPLVIVPLGSGKFTRTHGTGENTMVDFSAGQAYWYEADPQGIHLRSITQAQQPIELIVIELQPEVIKAWNYYKQHKV